MEMEIWYSKIVIYDYTFGYCPAIEKLFSVYDPLTHMKYLKGCVYDYETKTLILPRGLNVERLLNLLGSGLEPKVITRPDPVMKLEKPIMMKYHPKSEVQREALHFALGIQGYERNKAKTQISINVNTGVGKTYIAIAAAAFLNMKELIITHTRDMMYQWKSEIKSFTDTEDREICVIENGSRDFHAIINGDKDVTEVKYFIVGHASINRFGNNFGWDKISDFFQTIGIGLKVFDEAHKYFDNLLRIDFTTNTWKTIYLPATPERSDREENRIYQASFSAVPAIDLFDENNDPRTHYVALHYSSRPTPYEAVSCDIKHGGFRMFNAAKYADYVVNKPEFFKMLFIVMEIARVRGKSIFYIESIHAIDIIYNWMVYTFPELEGQIGILHSKIPDEVRDYQTQMPIILTTIKSCGEGKHIDNLALGVLLAAPYSSKPLLRQVLGRMRNFNTMLIYCIDHGFQKINGYYQSSLGMFAKYALDVSDLNLRGKEKLDGAYMTSLRNRNQYYEELYCQPREGKIKVVSLVDSKDIL
jgi:hypothetical protein